MRRSQCNTAPQTPRPPWGNRTKGVCMVNSSSCPSTAWELPRVHGWAAWGTPGHAGISGPAVFVCVFSIRKTTAAFRAWHSNREMERAANPSDSCSPQEKLGSGRAEEKQPAESPSAVNKPRPRVQESGYSKCFRLMLSPRVHPLPELHDTGAQLPRKSVTATVTGVPARRQTPHEGGHH